MVTDAQSSLEALVTEAEQAQYASPGDEQLTLSALRFMFLTAEVRKASHTNGLRLSTQQAALRAEPVYLAFRAAFTAIGAKYTPWPHEQFALFREASALIDPLLAAHPGQKELRFLRGAIYHKLPAFLFKSDLATADLILVAQALIARSDAFEGRYRVEIIRYILQTSRLELALGQALEQTV